MLDDGMAEDPVRGAVSAGARELEPPPNKNVRPLVYRPRGTGVFPLALSSNVMTNCPQVGVVKIT